MKKILVSIFFIFACTGSSCELFTPQHSPHQPQPQNPQTPSPSCNKDSDCVLVRQDDISGFNCCPNYKAFYKSETLPPPFHNTSTSCRTLVPCARAVAKCNNSRCDVQFIDFASDDF